jgi:hypothetical protein
MHDILFFEIELMRPSLQILPRGLTSYGHGIPVDDLHLRNIIKNVYPAPWSFGPVTVSLDRFSGCSALVDLEVATRRTRCRETTQPLPTNRKWSINS